MSASIRLKVVFGQIRARNSDTCEIIPYVNQKARGVSFAQKRAKPTGGHLGMMHRSVIDSSSDVRRLKIPVLLEVTTTENYGCKIVFIN